MTIAIVIVIALVATGASGLFAVRAAESARHAGNHARDAAAFARRGAETAAESPLEIDRGIVRPLRLVHDETHERLVGASLRRHPVAPKP